MVIDLTVGKMFVDSHLTTTVNNIVNSLLTTVNHIQNRDDSNA
jgi:hypothetical protein